MRKFIILGVMVLAIVGCCVVYNSVGQVSGSPAKTGPAAGGIYSGQIIAVEHNADNNTIIYFASKKVLEVMGNYNFAIGTNYTITVAKEKEGYK